jgi:hypothetical protein
MLMGGRKETEKDTRFVDLGRYLCEVRAGQYWRSENLKSFDDFLERPDRQQSPGKWHPSATSFKMLGALTAPELVQPLLQATKLICAVLVCLPAHQTI